MYAAIVPLTLSLQVPDKVMNADSLMLIFYDPYVPSAACTLVSRLLQLI